MNNFTRANDPVTLTVSGITATMPRADAIAWLSGEILPISPDPEIAAIVDRLCLEHGLMPPSASIFSEKIDWN